MNHLNPDLDNIYEFMQDVTREQLQKHTRLSAKEEVYECLKKAQALRDEPLLEVDQRNLVNEICDQLLMIERLL